jgi:hypothetical protein
MRIVFSVLFVTISILSAFAQNEIPVDETTGLITYKEVVEEQGTKDELYNRGASWLHTFYVNPWEVAKVRDQSTGLIKIQHQFRLDEYDDKGNKLVGKTILYSARIEFKDGRYRYVIDNFVLKEMSRYPVEKWLDKKAPDYNPKWDVYLGQIDAYVRDELVKSLKENMKPPKEVKEDVW